VTPPPNSSHGANMRTSVLSTVAISSACSPLQVNCAAVSAQCAACGGEMEVTAARTGVTVAG
jgi:hypothetical protein